MGGGIHMCLHLEDEKDMEAPKHVIAHGGTQGTV